ncbi:hypothetical protein ACJJTC_017466, partial [Scirpophaga incertulas]
QFGFRHGKSTEDAVSLLVNLISSTLDGGITCLGVFLDLAKAFDSISSKILLRKLERFGIRGLALEWFESYLSDRQQLTKGAHADADDKAAAKELVTEMEKELEGDVAVVKVPQGRECKHFLAIFKGALAVIFGSKDNEYQADNSRHSYEDDNIRLFKVEGTELGVDMRAVQLKEEAALLEDDAVFVLETKETIYVWNGKDSDSAEQEAALAFVEKVVKEKSIESVNQGEEPEEFWEALGGPPDDSGDSRSGWKSNVNRRVTSDVTLTAVSVSMAGKVKFEELDPDFTQQDLSEDSIYILDKGEEMYLWQGVNTPERVKVARDNIIKEYIEDDGLERTIDNAVVVMVKQGKEPAVFKKLFPEWDPDMWSVSLTIDISSLFNNNVSSNIPLTRGGLGLEYQQDYSYRGLPSVRVSGVYYH